MQPDYLIIGSGLSALTFGALMANAGKTVQILEAHEHPGGFGHTFTMAKKYTFNAQFHYVWDCGEGQTVNKVLKKLGLDKAVTFERYDPNGFDHMRMPGYEMDIPSDPFVLVDRLSALFPDHSDGIRQFVNEVEKTGAGLKIVAPPLKPIELLKHPSEVLCTVWNLNSTLQDVFDKFQLPQAAQTLLALQWLDFLLPPSQLSFEYSASNYMVYCVVKDLDLRDYGFGKWNVSHTGHESLNEAFAQMYDRHDYSNPSFAITTPTLLTETSRDCPADCQIVEFLTVANYAYFKQLRDSDPKAYRQKKQEILDSILDVVEKHYVPNFREHMVFEITGSPTTNERYCWCPEGNSYGSILTPRNMGLGRLNHETSLGQFYFCNASSGYPGFAPTIWTGALLYQRLSGDAILG
jgi:phytoene dehydrogenase-like protein